jgi:YHS domain-containing protein
MKTLKSLVAATVLTGFCLAPFVGMAEDVKTEKKDTYPLQTCVVSGEKLGEMGDPYIYTHEGREVRLCCKGCLKDFKKDPAKYLKKLDEAGQAAAKK